MNLYDLSSSSSASSGVINIAVSAKKIDVDNRIALRYYYRIAENMLKQASIYREEKNLIDLYILLLRFSSLISDTIPCHKDYQSFSPKEKKLYKKRLLDTVAELEVLKPIVLPQIEESNQRHSIQANQWDKNTFEDNSDNLIEWPPVRRQAPRNYDSGQVNLGVIQAGSPLVAQQHKQVGWDRPSQANFIEDHLSKLSLSVPRPSEETLSRHSILGHSVLHNQRQAPIYDKRVQYPGNLDLTPVQLPSLTYKAQDPLGKGGNNFVSGTSIIESVLSLDDGRSTSQPENSWPVATMSMVRPPVQFDIIRQPSVPPVLADVHDLVPASSPLTGAQPLPTKSLQDDHAPSGPLQLHVPPRLMDDFMRMAKSNTQKNLETCGVLAGSLKNRKFYVTTILIPKQESTSDSCQTLNEEEIFEAQDSRSLFPLGWIHTHPTQSCFMSSIDLHTHYSYQIMLPEAIAIVMAPTDTTRTHGIFRLSDPGGIKVIRNCQERGFHPHDEPPDGSPIYELCTNVYMNPNIKFEVIDLR